MSLNVLLVGHGFMGTNHRNKIEALDQTRLAGIVDPDSSRDPGGIPFYQTLETGFIAHKPDIISICSNTKTHFETLSKLCALSKEHGIFPHILMEKPFVANSKQAAESGRLLADYPGKISGGYLFRQSPIVANAIEQMKNGGSTIQKVLTVWQKDRMQKGPVRPSEGVHIDESTHPIDLVINYVLPEMGITFEGVTILESSFKRQSVAGQIVDQDMQNALYKDEPEKLDPIAEVTYTLQAGGIPIEGFSSFAKGPQKREITIELSDNTTFFLEFDLAGSDCLFHKNASGEVTLIAEHKCDKLMLEWEAFLEFCETGEQSRRIQTFSEMEFDIRLTEAFSSQQPLQTSRFEVMLVED